MLLAMFTVFLQFQRSTMYSKITTGNETLYTRASDQLSWIAAREGSENMSYSILPGMRDARAHGLLNVGDFAWIDGKEYTFSYAKSPGQNVTQKCIGIVKLDRDNFEFGTTSCDENHTVICDATGVDTALTLTTRNELMPRVDDLKARIASNQGQNQGLMFISMRSTSGVLLLAIAIIVLVETA